jgi:hypothetical protein
VAHPSGAALEAAGVEDKEQVLMQRGGVALVDKVGNNDSDAVYGSNLRVHPWPASTILVQQ